jgi:acetyltransferase-like isoleucine patch superfamily enzyme
LLYRLLRWCPGALGLFLRKKLYPRYVKECGRNVLFGRFVELRGGRDSICIGSGVVVNDFVTLQGDTGKSSGKTLIIGDNVFIGAGTTIKLTDSNIMIQSGSSLGSGCVVRSDQSVLIEDDVLAAAFCEIGKSNSNGGQLPVDKKPCFDLKEKNTRIGSGGWLGVRAKIKAGVQIGKGTIIGAHSTVIADIPDHVIAIGCPAKVLRKRQ